MPTANRDDRLFALMREELARTGDVDVPPLSDLSARARARARTRRGHVVGATAAAAATATVAAGALWISGPSAVSPAGTSTAPATTGTTPAATTTASGAPISGTFSVPTYQGNVGLFASIRGVLSFTPSGCPLGGPGDPIIFPNAIGQRTKDGVRMIVDADTNRVLAVEGQPFAGAGGNVRVQSIYGQAWASLCPDTPIGDGITVLGTVHDRAFATSKYWPPFRG